MIGAQIDVKPSNVNLDEMRKLLHTPKEALLIPESADFYREQIQENQYLREFIQEVDERLAKDISETLKKVHVQALQAHLSKGNSIRKGYKMVKRKDTYIQNKD